jgi:hypothetical protein
MDGAVDFGSAPRIRAISSTVDDAANGTGNADEIDWSTVTKIDAKRPDQEDQDKADQGQK